MPDKVPNGLPLAILPPPRARPLLDGLLIVSPRRSGPDHAWKAAAAYLSRGAAAVLIVIGSAEAPSCEIDTSLAEVARERLLSFFR